MHKPIPKMLMCPKARMVNPSQRHAIPTDSCTYCRYPVAPADFIDQSYRFHIISASSKET